MYESDKESEDKLGFFIFIVMMVILCGGLIIDGWKHRNDPPRKTIREMVTEIHQKIVIEP